MQKLISAIWAVSITAFWLDLSTALSVLIARVGRGRSFGLPPAALKRALPAQS
jgi:hypothetical protein